jgi:hypothetical protein
MRHRKAREQCQFAGVLLEAAAVIISANQPGYQEAIGEWVCAEAEKRGFSRPPGKGLWEFGKQWLSHSVVEGEMEMSGMCWLFCQWGPASVEEDR